MPTPNRISAVLTAADVTAIQAAITTVKSKLPFLISLTADDRQGLRKMGSKRYGYFNDVAAAVNAFPNTMPSNFPTAEFLKDTNLMNAMQQIVPQLEGLLSNIDDTMIQLGAELMANTDTAYDYLKTAAKTDANIKPAVENIASGLKRSSNSSTTPPPANP